MSKAASRYTARKISAKELRGHIAFAAWEDAVNTGHTKSMLTRDSLLADNAYVNCAAEVATQSSMLTGPTEPDYKPYPVLLARCANGKRVPMPALLTFSFYSVRGKTMRRVDVLN